MKNTKLTLAMVLLCGGLAACKPDTPEPTPVPEVEAVATQPDAAPVVEAPMAPDAEVEAMADGMDGMDDGMDDEADGDTPHSGGDKVAPASDP